MKKVSVILMLALAIALTAAENLLPGVETPKAWETARNAAAEAIFDKGELNGQAALQVAINSDSGYAFYRHFVALSPGEYTFSVSVQGRTEQGIVYEIYSFDKENKGKLISMQRSPAGPVAAQVMGNTFRVPEDSIRLRVGIGFSGRGTALFAAPTLVKGKAELPQPPKKAAPDHPVLEKWIAEWLWLKNDSGVPRVLFSRKIELADEAENAVIQLTADNCYTVVVNGKIVGSDVDWQTVEKYDIASYLKKGVNEIVLDIMNYDGSGGVVMQGFILDRGGKFTTLQTDKDWSIALPDGQAAELAVLGAPPVHPWRKLPFHRVVPPEQIKLKMTDAAIKVQAGGTLKFEFDTDHEFSESELKELKLQFIDGNGRVTPLSAFEPIIRQEMRIKKLFVELPVSRFAAPGVYRWQLSGLLYNLVPGQGASTVTVLAADLSGVKSGGRFPKYAANVMETPGGKQSLFTYATGTPLLDSYVKWTRTGGHMYEVTIKSGQWLSSGKYDTSEAEKNILQILEADPNAGIYIKFRVDIPGWWAGKYPDDIFRSNKNRTALQSFCSLNWRSEAIEAVNAAMKELGGRPVGQGLSGAMLMGFRGGEFQLWGEDVGEYDCSPAAVREFEKYQQSQGIKELVKLPHPALEFPFKGDDAESQRVRGIYFRFLAERHADNLIYFAREFKKTFGDKYAFGVYFGYGMEHSNGIKRMLYGGHLGISKVILEAPLDILSCPFSYSLRRKELSHAFMNPLDSALLHGIMGLPENDVRNFKTPYFADSSGSTILTLSDSIVNDRRMRLLAASHGVAVRYLALLEGFDFYANLPVIRAIAEDNQLMMKLQPMPIGAPEQIAMVTDQLSWTRAAELPDAQNLLKDFCSQGRDVLMRTGRSVVFLIMEDYLAHIDKWQNAVIPLPGLLSEEVRQKLAAKFGELPEIPFGSGALVIAGGKISVVGDSREMRDLLATPAAKAAGYEMIWYIGQNFQAAWDGQALHIDIK